MIYDLSKQIDAERAKKRFNALLEEQTVVTLTKKVKRSLRQNGYLHLILGWFAMETGYTLSEAKDIYKRCSKDIFFYKKNEHDFIRSTADLSSSDMTVSIAYFRVYSDRIAEIYLPEPNEEKFLQEIEIEMQRQRV